MRTINKKLTASLKRYIVLGHERMTKYSISNTNDIALQIIHREHNSDCHRKTGGNRPDRPSALCGRKDFSLEESGVRWRKDKYHEYDVDENNGQPVNIIETD
jgi:hypothetical protein